MRHKMNTIRSDHHQISSYQINKTSLSCYDDKRYILDDGISLAYGHFSINKKIDRQFITICQIKKDLKLLKILLMQHSQIILKIIIILQIQKIFFL